MLDPETYINQKTKTLLEMLTYRRPAGSKTERKFIRRFISPLGMNMDKAGNLWKRIGDAPVMWSCHTDTVHSQGGRQNTVVAGGGMVGLANLSHSTCLGADDTAGVWLMREMILAEKPGLYIFHRGEEMGGIGSSHIAHKTPELLDGIKCAIALDRKGTRDVITHQGVRCCSDEFAESLSTGLKMDYRPSSNGIFTDTANYTDLVGECTNLSVGYYDQHTKKESLDIPFLHDLLKSLLDLDTDALAIVRKPAEHDPQDWEPYRYDGKGDGYAAWDKYFAEQQSTKDRPVFDAGKDDDDQDWYPPSHTTERLIDLCREHPAEIADLLQDLGIGSEEAAREILDRGGVIRH